MDVREENSEQEVKDAMNPVFDELLNKLKNVI